jgi:8-oxo-dGTP diphosphatase
VQRAFPDRPIVAVGAVVFDEAGRVVLVRRGQPPLSGRWSLPGGALEVGESLATATVREVREETGLDVDVGPRLEVVEHVSHDEHGRVAFHYVIVDFLCRVTGGTLLAGSDVIDAAYVWPHELQPFGLTPTAERVIAQATTMRGA